MIVQLTQTRFQTSRRKFLEQLDKAIWWFRGTHEVGRQCCSVGESVHVQSLSMRAFKISLNGEKLCLAGIDHDGVLTALVNSVTGNGREDLFLEVGGLVSQTEEHVKWINQKRLSVGDRIQVQIIETRSADKPRKRYRINPAERLRSQKRYVRIMAKQLGWKIQT